ncbi:GNAT family N-acetyltransferase [Aquincola sp. S2]|uniref:GNAT family N-acetyltransferase n=2 Tax=Pseudaquabacterium terrae TaxID=2732868 RepID=A0ABX2ELU2_9BURK|nr:GNAT family N-acetyltransferase [Aquabacterium terrae]NRF69621.1 GNAT family N-acetyltransferase [Aquabacterium terrae]
MFEGPRVRLRAWRDDDLPAFAALNADPEVMRYLKAPLAREDSDAMARRMAERLQSQGWGHYALDVPGLGFAGFVGLSVPPFTIPLPGFDDAPQLEIGWRLARAAWGQGYASEAARLLLDFARDELRRPRIVSFTTVGNLKSQAVMQRLALALAGAFDHPNLPGHPLQPHLLYCTPPGWSRAA